MSSWAGLVAALTFAGVARAQARQPAPLARPTPAQYAYQELERILFIHFHPGTWSGREYDDGKTDLSTLHPSKLDVDQWCEAAKSWDAKMILLSLIHI